MPAVKISMASAHDDTDLRGLPAAYLQQVMSPSGQAAAQQGHTPEAPDGVPNGTGDALTRSVRAGDDEAYVQALAGTAAVEMSGGVSGIAGEHRQSGSMTRSASAEPMGAEDRPLLPHAAMGTEVVPMVRETRGSASMLPSPLPSPMSTSGPVTQATDVASGVHGSSLAQHGAAAIRWFSKLGDYMQRRSTTVSRTQPGMETTVVREETVWSPSGHRPAAAAGTDPLFSGAQVQRMQEMAAAAPQLYGASGTRGPSSEDSGSYSKDQLEAEVKRQVQAALSGQRDLMEENYKLRLEVERLARASASSEGGSFLPDDGRLVASPPGLSGVGQGSAGLPEGNPAGLPFPGREQGGESELQGRDGVPGGNLQGLSGQDGGQRVEGHLGQYGVADGNLRGPLGQDREQGSFVENGFQETGHANLSAGRLPGGNPPGLPVPGREQGGRVRFQTEGDQQGDPAKVPVRDSPVVEQGRDKRDSLPGGNPAGLPVPGREQGGVFKNFMQYATGISGVSTEPQYATGISGRPWNPLGVGSSKPTAAPRTRTTTSEGPTGSDTKPSNPMEALMQGMSQLQAAMAMQIGANAAKPEQIRPGATELPKLAEADENAAINVGDWLHGLSGPMGDLTDGSSVWWGEVMKSLDDYYKEFVTATTVRKTQLRSEDYARPLLQDPKWLRVDRRAATMLLQAVPENIRSELMANRLGTTLAILCRIIVIYRPGSSIERQQVLKALECPGVGTTPLELVEILRKWSRWLKRAGDPGVQPPDASILLKGLDVASRSLMEKNSEIAFRANMMRYSLDLDSAPSQATVVRFHGHLLAEYEQLAYRGRGKGGTANHPTLKAMTTPDAGGSQTPKGGTSPTTTSGAKPCKFYASDMGCQRKGCKFLHDWDSFSKEEKSDRCKGCGGRGHMKKTCPMKALDGGGRDDGKGKGYPKVKSAQQGRGGDGKRDDGTLPGSEPSTSTAAASSSSSASTTMDSSTTTTSAPTSTSSAQEMDEFLRNATQVLKMMSDKQGGFEGGAAPSMKMLKRVMQEYQEKMALVDSGATHPLRVASGTEWETAPEVDVVVAGDGVQRMKQNSSGTLLLEPSPRKTQTIIPMGSLISLLGYEVTWTRRRCILRAPDGEEISLKVSAGCPELSETLALELISKIETEKLEQFRRKTAETELAVMRAKMVEVTTLWESSLREYVENGKFDDGFRAVASMPWFADLPREHLVKLATDLPKDEGQAWELMKSLGLNRRVRKRLMHRDWVVKFYSGKRGPSDKIFRPLESNNTIVLDVDLLRDAQWDVLREGDGIYKLLLWGASTGRLAGALASLPNTASYEHLLRLVWIIMETAKEGRQVSCGQMDIPDDGVAFAIWASSEAEEDPSAKAFGKEWFKQWMLTKWAQVLHFEQGGLGHPTRRPTTMATNMDITELRGVRDERQEEAEWGSRSTWAPMMMHVLVRGWKRWKSQLGWYPRMVKALKAADRRAWERHLANDHVPHRPDCLQCVHNSTGRPHRKCLHKDCYVMSADTLGPVRVPGPKGERFAVVFTYQYPRQKMSSEDVAIPDEELEGWDLDVIGPTIEERNQVPEEEDLEDYSPDAEPGEELTEEQKEMIRELPLLHPTGDEETTQATSGSKKASEDWWEFRESEALVVRHHVLPRTTLFRPTSTNGCPIPTFKLEPTRITEIKYVGGGVELETSDWHGPQSGARALDKSWTGSTRFRVSAAEMVEDEEQLQRDEKTWEQLIGDLTKPVEMETIYLVYPVRARRGGEVMLAIQEAVLRLKLLGLPVARLHSDRGSEFAQRACGSGCWIATSFTLARRRWYLRRTAVQRGQ